MKSRVWHGNVKELKKTKSFFNLHENKISGTNIKENNKKRRSIISDIPGIPNHEIKVDVLVDRCANSGVIIKELVLSHLRRSKKNDYQCKILQGIF
jgi:hypothetical protein